MKIIVNWLDDNFLEHKNNENERKSISKDNSLIVKVNFILFLLYILF